MVLYSNKENPEYDMPSNMLMTTNHITIKSVVLEQNSNVSG